VKWSSGRVFGPVLEAVTRKGITMGNHEFCVECGASDFHYGRECDPKRNQGHGPRRGEVMDAREWLETNGTGDSGLVAMDIAMRMMNRFAAAVLREMANEWTAGAWHDAFGMFLEAEADRLEGSK
jgi:hypothetical protein